MRRPFPHAAALVVALAMSSCTGTGSADPTTPPSASSSASSPSTPTTPETPLPTATPSPTATATPDPTPPATPSPTFTGGIDPPTEAPEGFSEFSVPPPQDLTEEYAAWVLAVFADAEDRLIKMTVEAPDAAGNLPDDIRVGLDSLYSGDSLATEEALARATVAAPPSEEAFKADPGRTRLSHIRLLDATQECLLMIYAEDRDASVKADVQASEVIALFKPKPEIDASSFNATPWQMTNRTVPEDVEGRTCG